MANNKLLLLTLFLYSATLWCAQELDIPEIPVSIFDEQARKEHKFANTLWSQQLWNKPPETIYAVQPDGWSLLSHYFISSSARQALHVQIEVDHDNKFKVDFNKPDKNGTTPLMLTAFKIYWLEFDQSPTKVLRSLLDLKADPTAKDFKGRTALDYATAAESLLLGHDGGIIKKENPLIDQLGLAPENNYVYQLLEINREKQALLKKAVIK